MRTTEVAGGDVCPARRRHLREELLGLPGIGPETADSILLYAASREVFVVDSYTRRIFERHELAEADADYDEIRLAVEKALADRTIPR